MFQIHPMNNNNNKILLSCVTLEAHVFYKPLQIACINATAETEYGKI